MPFVSTCTPEASSKSHVHSDIVAPFPLDVLVNMAVLVAQSTTAVKAAVGKASIGIKWLADVIEVQPDVDVTDKVTAWFPGVLKICDGFCWLLTGVASSKSQVHVAIEPEGLL